jgi:hypothetical protein
LRNPSVRRVELSFPSRPDLALLARMTVSAIASRADFEVDQVEDLRLAIDELCVTLMGDRGRSIAEVRASPSRIGLTFEWTDDTITVSGRLAPPDVVGRELAHSPRRVRPDRVAPAQLHVNERSGRILDALVDEHGVDDTDSEPCMWLTVHRRPRP